MNAGKSRPSAEGDWEVLDTLGSVRAIGWRQWWTRQTQPWHIFSRGASQGGGAGAGGRTGGGPTGTRGPGARRGIGTARPADVVNR